jgi:hypothetical protein
VLLQDGVTDVGVFNPSFTVSNEAGTSAAVQVEVEVTDVDETVAPVLPGLSLTLISDSPNNIAGAVVGTLTVGNLTTPPVLSGQDASRFAVAQEGDVLTISVVSPLTNGDYIAVLSSENRDPDGQFVVPISSVLSVKVVTETRALVSFDTDLTCGHTRLKDLTETGGSLHVTDYGKLLRVHVGFNIKGTPVLEFYPKTGSTGSFSVTTEDGVEVGGLDVVGAKGALYEAGEYITYLLPEGRFSHAGGWGLDVFEEVGASQTKIGTVSFTIKE